jgi:CRISPR-associated Csx2 family protein
MAKILITSIGKGTYDKESNAYSYNKAKYYDGKKREKIVETPYVFVALRQFKDFDKCIFIGTCGSGWGALYEYLYSTESMIDPALPKDEEYSVELMLLEEEKGSTANVAAFSEKLQNLKNSLPFEAEIVILKYGLDSEEILGNFNELANSLKNMVNDGDEICFDITHSFRSLAFYELLTVNFLKDALKKDIKIDYASYGMLEYSRENDGLTPIVDLSQLTKVFDWIKAAEEYKRFGTAKLLAELLEKNSIGIEISKEEIKALRRLGGTDVSTNGINEFRYLVKNCRKVVDGGYAKKNLVIGFIFEEIQERFGDKIDDDDLLCMELAKWHLEKGRYMECTTCLVERILEYCADVSGKPKDWDPKKDKYEDRDDCVRERIKSVYKVGIAKKYWTVKKVLDKNPKVKAFVVKYYDENEGVRRIRNNLLHGNELQPKEIKKLQNLCDYFATTIIKDFKNNPKNEEVLKKVLLMVNQQTNKEAPNAK